MKTLLLSKDDVGSLVDLDAVQAAVEEGYRSFNSGKVIQPEFIFATVPGTNRSIDFKAGLDMGGGYFVMKASSGGFDENPGLGLPVGFNTVLLFDAATSACKCIMDGTWITGCRTGAAGAISVKYLARKDAKKLCVIGAGRQARRQLLAMMRVREFDEVRVWDSMEPFLEQYVREMGEETGLKLIKCVHMEDAVRDADVIVSTTRGRGTPKVQRAWLKPGVHIAAIGADMPDKQEYDTEVFRGAKIVNDSIELCTHHGETHHSLDAGVIRRDDIHGEIGEILLGRKCGRENDTEITIFDTVGMSIQDNVMAQMLYHSALEKGMGSWFEFYRT